jgi:hypothetical protein
MIKVSGERGAQQEVEATFGTQSLRLSSSSHAKLTEISDALQRCIPESDHAKKTLDRAARQQNI